MALSVSDDLMAPEVIADPHSYYRRLRDQNPVHWNDRWGSWVLTRHDDVVQVLRDSEAFSSDRMGYLERELTENEVEPIAPIFDILSRWIVFTDPPLHTKLRMLVNRKFSPKMVETYRGTVRKIVNDVLDEIEPQGHMEVVRDFAYQVPMTVILELMGVPDLIRVKIKEWSEQLGLFFFIRADDPRRRQFAAQGVSALAGHLTHYLTHVIDEKAKNPDNDLISRLLRAEMDGELTRDDVVATCVLLALGGHETTMNLIANGTLALIRHPDQWERLKEDPGIIKTAVEELLRYDGSVMTTVRWARRDVEIGGETIKAGQRVLVGLSGANRDPAQFEDPDVLDLTRDPNLHVAFAHGIHVCVGAPLARMEVQEAFMALTSRLPCPTLETEELEYLPTVVGRSLRALRVVF